ncbi:MAG: hypothetical protein ACE5E1_01110 [Phycisphaerae bacterium]
MSLLQVDLNPPPRTLRQFGLIGLAGFGALAVLARFQWLLFAALPDSAVGSTVYALAGLAMFCGLFAMLAPTWLRPLFVVMTLITLPIGWVVSYLVMFVIFYVVLTPVGLVFKLIGRDAMNRQFDRSSATYWIKRTPPASAGRYFRQF